MIRISSVTPPSPSSSAVSSAILVPSYDTLRRLWQEWFGPGGARRRYARSADLPKSDGPGAESVVELVVTDMGAFRGRFVVPQPSGR
ncbi:hypothetical protein [Streptomyces sp. NRRL F-2580]|uniref:hypothetical protein n=1 Tax=Streptomyces sp. NRRL F-2580 TaxID=1463841 RepID=UPI0004CA7BF2|nr:hypothetical protein [Streptomyces sp. NRRL F-2580]